MFVFGQSCQYSSWIRVFSRLQFKISLANQKKAIRAEDN